MGITECDNVLMLLGVSQSVKEKEGEKATPLMIKGFRDAAEKGGTAATGGQWTTLGLSPWGCHCSVSSAK
ncbi:hypothetical protein U0070_024697 [Myodes glareolus]|uniref:Uncharacterized protein n=1 Tax=Myodes glareolus TaxID=447135 RepID=A0AAW0HQD7_MYOGA